MAVAQQGAQPTQPLSICGLQLECHPTERDWNLRHADALVRANPGHDLYVMPELSSCGYDELVFTRLEDFAEDVRAGPTTTFMAALAREVQAHICYGLVRRAEGAGGRPYRICQAVVGPDGSLVAQYDKMHLCHYGECAEKDFFSRGELPCTFEVCGWTLGLLICCAHRFAALAAPLSHSVFAAFTTPWLH